MPSKSPEERALVKALLINKFRGDIASLRPGIDFLEGKTGKRILGVLPFVRGLQVAEEDMLPESKLKTGAVAGDGKLRIEVIHFPHISNATDFDPLEREPDVTLQFLTRVPEAESLPDALILPGSKSTLSDLAYVRSSGFARYIGRCREAGVAIIGICGGYQMLGKELFDPEGVESATRRAKGLALLHLTTRFEREKRTVRVTAADIEAGHEFAAYEIHMGRTEGPDTARPVFRIVNEMGSPSDRFDGAKSADGLVWGTYLHGLFDEPAFRREFLNVVRSRRGWAPLPTSQSDNPPEAFHSLASLIRAHLDLQCLHQILDGTL